MRRIVFLGLLAAMLAGCALFQSDAERGRKVADTWCSECHRVAPDEPSGARPGHTMGPPVVAPSFMDVAARPYTTADSLDHFLADLHLPMPTYRLSDGERREVIAYILSLRTPPR
jgi:mono/diheme cytochrome c family protein